MVLKWLNTTVIIKGNRKEKYQVNNQSDKTTYR
jgi:hypothetical protein